MSGTITINEQVEVEEMYTDEYNDFLEAVKAEQVPMEDEYESLMKEMGRY